MAASTSPPLSTYTLATSVASQDGSTVRFVNVKEFFQAIDRVSGDCLAVTGMKKFARIFKILYTNYQMYRMPHIKRSIAKEDEQVLR